MTKATTAGSAWKQWAAAMLCIAAVICFLFRQSFQPEKVLFSNDAPLGLISSTAGVNASTFDGIVTGFWQDLNWVGIEMPSVLPGLSWGMFQLFGSVPVMNAKWHVPLSFLYLGFAAWMLFRTLGFRQVVCVIGGLAAMLNTDPFSHGAWGLPSRALTFGSALLALAALYSGLRGRAWIKAALAGMCVGLGIVEGFDVGALYSLYVAAFALFVAFLDHPATEEKNRRVKSAIRGGILVAVVAISAALYSAQALSMLVGTQIQGIQGMGQDTKSKEERWDAATAWSLPKTETLRVIIPGLFGYRMDTGGGGQYWGSVGYPAYQRHSGAGEYAGILVVMLGIWGAANAFRKKETPYDDRERRMVIFWSVAAVVSLLFAWGRWAPFYKLIYNLPFFSTIRNPIKFMHFFQMSLLILFGYGLDLVFRRYMNGVTTKSDGMMENFKAWWAGAQPFERKVILGFAAGLGASLIGLLMYSSSKDQVVKYLGTVGFPDAPTAKSIVDFSIGEVGIYILFFALALIVFSLCLSGYFTGKRARWAALAIGGLIVVDLARANQPWIIYYNYKDRYASNSVLNFLRTDSLEHRVTTRMAPFAGGSMLVSKQFDFMLGVFSEWLQNQFQFYNIQSIDIVQMPRTPELDAHYRDAFMPYKNELELCGRLWELSNTRYIIGQKEFLNELNTRFDPLQRRFQIATNFDWQIKPGVDASSGSVNPLNDLDWELNPNGKFSIFEFTGALPRYKLYTHWAVQDDEAALTNALRTSAFDVHQTVIVHDDSIKPSAAGTNAPGSVELVSYAPKRIEVKTQASAPSILLWNDRWSPNWQAFVDGQPVKLLRCNYIMRGIETPAGTHKVEMRYAQPARFLWVSFATMALGVLFCFFLAFDSRRSP